MSSAQQRPAWDAPAASTPAGAPARRWYVLWTHSHCEQLVHDQLAAEGLELLLPKLDVWSRRGGVRRLVPAPMFPGYLFLRHAMDKAGYLLVSRARGLVRILGARWDRLEPVPDAEIEAIRRLGEARLPVLPHPFLREGRRVRVRAGALKDVEGFLVQSNPKRGLLVLSVELLQRSVAVAVDATLVEPA